MVTDVATPRGRATPRSLPRMAPQMALVAVGVSYLVLQLTLFSLHRGASYDEAVYLAQVQPGAPNVFFGSWRARGITFLVAPVLLAHGSLLAVRVFLAVASAAALTAAAWLWVPLVGWAATGAAVIFGFSWPALYYGSEVLPNLWAAFLALASVGYVARYLVNRAGRIELVLGCAALALMALFRPLDAVPVAVGIAAFVLLFHRRSVRLLVPVAAGLAIGWVPWLIEMIVRFGDPFLALYRARAAAKVGTAAPGFHFSQNLALTNG